MAQATSELLAPQDAPEFGTCRLALERESLWWVRGNSGWHLVSADSGECTCGHWRFRCAYTRNLCRHGEALKAHIEALLACPVCHGKGVLIPSGLIPYVRVADGVRDTGGAVCVRCEGSGRR